MSRLKKSVIKTLLVLFWIVFSVGIIWLLGKVEPRSRGAIHRVAGYLFLDSLAERFLPLEEHHHHGEGEHHHDGEGEHHHDEEGEHHHHGEGEHHHDEEGEHHHDEEGGHHHDAEGEHHHDEEGGHHHDEDGEHHHDEGDEHHHGTAPLAGFAKEITLSKVAEKNFQIDDSAIVKVEVSDYYKTFSLPATLRERPGHSFFYVPAPTSGVVTHVYHEEGEVVNPGEPLFEILLNRQEMIQAQSEYLATLKAKEINNAEIERLSSLDPGIVPQKKRELTYEKQRLELDIVNQRRTLELMGLPTERITGDLEAKQEMVQSISVVAPESHAEEESHPDDEVILTIDELNVAVGQNITQGDALCRLMNLCHLVIEGSAFENDRDRLETALENRYEVTVVFGGNTSREAVSGLFIRSIENRVNADSGVLRCCVDIANRGNVYHAGDISGNPGDKRRYVNWLFQPGELCELKIPYDLLSNCIVLPADAVANDVVETCVFEWVGSEAHQKIWRRTPVHLLEKTKDTAVIANDGSLRPGALVTVKGAELLLSALTAQNQRAAGGGGGIQHGDHVH